MSAGRLHELQLGPALPRKVAQALSDIAFGAGLDPAATEQLAVLLRAMADPHAPTTVADPAAGVHVHIADALVGLGIRPLAHAAEVIDIGSGAGIPVLALAAALPDTRFVSLEAVDRKCAYQRAVAEAMGLTNVEVVHGRAEDWEPGMGRFSVVVARALAELAVLLEYAAPLLRRGGHLVAWKGDVDLEEARHSVAAAELLGFGPAAIHGVQPYRESRDRTLHVFEKVADTPTRFPRRPGMATKRPLRAEAG